MPPPALLRRSSVRHNLFGKPGRDGPELMSRSSWPKTHGRIRVIRMSSAPILLLSAGLAWAADSAQSGYAREIGKWRAEREAKLKADDGWLTVAGLHWLKEGQNRA